MLCQGRWDRFMHVATGVFQPPEASAEDMKRCTLIVLNMHSLRRCRKVHFRLVPGLEGLYGGVRSRTVPTCRVARERTSFCGRRCGDDCSTKRRRCSMSADDGRLDRIGTIMIRRRPPETLAVAGRAGGTSSTMGAMYPRACRRATPPGGWNDDPLPEHSGSYVS